MYTNFIIIINKFLINVALRTAEMEKTIGLERNRVLQELRNQMEEEKLRELNVAKAKQWVRGLTRVKILLYEYFTIQNISYVCTVVESNLSVKYILQSKVCTLYIVWVLSTIRSTNTSYSIEMKILSIL